MKLYSLALLSSLALVACGGGSDLDAEQVGYFKDAQNNRVFAYRLPAEGIEAAAVEAHAGQQMHTDGQLTRVYYWPSDAAAPGMEIAREPSLDDAADAIRRTGLDAWAYAAAIGPRGDLVFSDCRAGSTDSLCRQ